MQKFMFIVLMLVAIVTFTRCFASDADVASYNLSKDAELST